MHTSRTIRSGSKLILATLPIAALALQPAHGADLISPIVAAPIFAPQTRLFVEGGVFWTGGDPIQYGTTSDGFFGGKGILLPIGFGIADPTVKPKIGWDVAAGFDHRFAGTPWHINGQFRYGQAKGSGAFNQALSFVDVDGADVIVGSANQNTSASLKEYHWQADIGGGYDIFTGPASMQFNFGIRVAEISAKNTINSNGSFSATDGVISISESNSSTAVERRSFLGAGPRIGVEGSIPLFAALTFDYVSNAALLVGNTKIGTDTTSAFAFTFSDPPNNQFTSVSSSGNASSSYWSDTIVVGNVDVQAGFGYWFTPHMKLAVSYRLDAFFGALKQAPDSATNAPGQSIDRYYHGPKLTLTSRF